MTSRDLVINTLNHQPVQRAPRDLWFSPGVEMLRADEVAEMEIRYPRDIVPPEFSYPAGKRAEGKPYRVGRYTDAWGCTWHVADKGTAGRIETPPLATQAKMAAYQPPMEILTGAKLDRVDRSSAATSRFVLAGTQTRPCQRLQCLRGAKTALADLAHGTKPIRGLLAKLHDFSCREMQMWADTEVDGVALADDWGPADEPLIDLPTWRDLFRPLYREYCEILHAKDKFALFHAQGNLTPFVGDLVKLGIDAIHSDQFAANIQRWAKRLRGRVTFWIGVGPQQILASGTPEAIREAALRIRRALDFGSGGVIVQCEWGLQVPSRNIAAVFEQWMLPLPMHLAGRNATTPQL